MSTGNASVTYRTLEDIRQRKEELRRSIERDHQTIDKLYHRLFVKREQTTQGQFIANLISNGALAIDAFLLVRKLRKRHSGLFQSFTRKKQ